MNVYTLKEFKGFLVDEKKKVLHQTIKSELIAFLEEKENLCSFKKELEVKEVYFVYSIDEKLKEVVNKSNTTLLDGIYYIYLYCLDNNENIFSYLLNESQKTKQPIMNYSDCVFILQKLIDQLKEEKK